MRMNARSVLLVGAALLVLLSPGVHAMIIQGHSPIVLLVKDPNGNEYGCLGTSPLTCTSTSSSDFIDQIASEGPSYTFPTDPSCATTDCPIIAITNPTPGTWTVYYFSTLTSGSSSTYITVTQCTNTEPGSPCIMIDVVGSPTDPVPLSSGSSGSSPFIFPLPTPSVPEFPFGLLLVVGLFAPAMIVVGNIQRRRRAKVSSS